MGEPTGHTLLSEALRVINRAIEAHEDASPWRELVARTRAPEEVPPFGVVIYEGDPGHVVDRYSIRAHAGRFEVTEQGRLVPDDWHVSVDHLQRIVAEADRFIGAPEQLGLGWLEDRLGLRPQAKRPSGWRIGRARRPK
jgi:hypothetical protein